MLLHIFRNSTDAVAFPAGHVIFRAGDEGTAMYIVVEGQVDIVVGTEAVETVVAGSILGEMALIDNSPRSATAIAQVDCKLVPLDRRRFQFMVQEHPYFALEVMTIMANRLRRVNARMTKA
jgi:CRP-like cAMP-binding protein